MDQRSCILAPTDFSPDADRAMRRAASLAAALGSPLWLMHVLPPVEVLEMLLPGSGAGGGEAFRSQAERALAERAQRIGEQFGVVPECRLDYGGAHRAILQARDSLDAGLIVLGAQGDREGRFPTQTVGDTALKVAEHSRSATLLVRREALAHYSHVVACTKGVPADRAVIGWANQLSPADLLHLVSAYTVPYERRLAEWGVSQHRLETYAAREQDARTRKLSDLLSELGLPAARARLHVERGEPLATILRAAALWKAELLVVGRRAQAHPFSGRFASVARDITMRASIDVLIVPPPGTL